MHLFKSALATAAILVAATVARADHHQSADLVDTAVKAGGFDAFIATAKAAGLLDALQGEGPLTVFAPTDQAFDKLPKDTLESLLKPENKGKLASLLKYHVVSGRHPAAELAERKVLKTLLGQTLSIAANDEGITVNKAEVVKRDILASNGIIHVIDTVILPRAKGEEKE